MSDSETHLLLFISCLLCARPGAEQGVTEKTRPGPPHRVSPNREDGPEVGEEPGCGCQDGVGIRQEGTTQQAGGRRGPQGKQAGECEGGCRLCSFFIKDLLQGQPCLSAARDSSISQALRRE